MHTETDVGVTWCRSKSRVTHRLYKHSCLNRLGALGSWNDEPETWVLHFNIMGPCGLERNSERKRRIQDFRGGEVRQPRVVCVGGRGAPTYYSAKISWKLHENEETWTRPRFYYVDPPLRLMAHTLCGTGNSVKTLGIPVVTPTQFSRNG